MSADPLWVKCPRCGSTAGNDCLVYYSDMKMIARGPREPHRARVKAAERAEREKVNRG